MTFYQFIKELTVVVGISSRATGVEDASKLEKEKLRTNPPKDLMSDFGYKPLGRLPSWFRSNSRVSDKGIKKINRYLSFQENRIKKAVMNKEFKKAILI